MSPLHLRNPKEPASGQTRTVQSQKTGHWTPLTQHWMERHLGKSCPLCHSPSNPEETSNHCTGSIWIKLFSSINTSNTYCNGEWTKIGSTQHHTGNNLEQVSRRYVSKRCPSKILCHYPSYKITIEPDRAYSDSSRLTRSKPTQPSSGFKPFRKQQISGQESPFFTFPGSFKQKTRIKKEKQDFFQQQEERVRPNDPEAVGLGERSTQEPEIGLNTSKISRPINKNITPLRINTMLLHLSNLNSD
ncbi:hypothetical protein O181_033912 [Austropuccinia psidii MF-1]|uniref:Uncharacterized protein n=1 Tax=Austropuccinia psidii MF-1 TaxID=1389203 RepID=A0A9Q3D295_9BASI|nr:hypothetical protein [Austropuccinia psidii MF-1]